MEETKEKRIIRFITYYRLLNVKQKGKLRKAISDKCEFKGGTFDYKIANGNYSKLEIDAIDEIIQAPEEWLTETQPLDPTATEEMTDEQENGEADVL